MGLLDVDPALLDVADRVCVALLRRSASLVSSDLMLVGAHCRDILHAAHGHAFGLRGTQDVDFGVALADWGAFAELTQQLTRVGDTGITFDVDGVPTDLMPFGPVENPAGLVTPHPREEPFSVWAFQEVFNGADALTLPTAGDIRIPSTPGYVALKLAAWLDRSAWGEYKDAGDLAAAMCWYADSGDVNERLYSHDVGTEILVQYDVDLDRGTSHLLGSDVAALIGPDRHAELRARWPGERGDLLPAEMQLPYGSRWPAATARRLERLGAFERGLGVAFTSGGPHR